MFIPLSVAVTKIEARTADALQIGTGVTVAPGVVVTNCHVTRKALTVIVTKAGAQFPVLGQAADQAHDLCFLRVPAWRGRSLEMADDAAITPEQRVGALGYTGGVDLQFQEGLISALHRFEDSRILQTTAAFTSGASGGALLNERGELVGILTFRLRARSKHYFAVPVRWIRRQVDALRFEPIAPLPEQRAFWEGQADALPYFMRIALLESQQQWDEMAKLAEQWSETESDNAEPLLAGSRAYQHLGREPESKKLAERAAALRPAETSR